MEKKNPGLTLLSYLLGYLGVAICMLAAIVYILLYKNELFGITFNKYVFWVDAYIAVIFVVLALILFNLAKNLKGKNVPAVEEPAALPAFVEKEEEEEEEEEEIADVAEVEEPEEEDDEEAPVQEEALPITEEVAEQEDVAEEVAEEQPAKETVRDDLTAAEILNYLQRKAKEAPQKAADALDTSVKKVKEALPVVAATLVTLAALKVSFKKRAKKKNL